jgi:hypothetical protein
MGKLFLLANENEKGNFKMCPVSMKRNSKTRYLKYCYLLTFYIIHSLAKTFLLKD